jgi:hypothetical protein
METYMKLVTYFCQPQQEKIMYDPLCIPTPNFPGILLDTGILPLSELGFTYPDWNTAIAGSHPLCFKTLAAKLRQADLATLSILPRSSVTLLAPIPQPRQDVLCIGSNYYPAGTPSEKRHPLDQTMYFSKRTFHLAGPGAVLPHHQDVTASYLYEMELGVVLGKTIYQANENEAAAAILGYTVFNDCTSAILCKKFNQVYIGKSLPGFSVMGPYIVTADEFAAAPEFTITGKLNNEIRQTGNTVDMIKNTLAILVEVSRYTVLAAGTILSTGTPQPITTRENPLQVKPGDHICGEISGVGQLDCYIAEA